MPTKIKGQPTSAEVLDRLAGEGRPVLLACSLGKDSLGAWCALRDAGIEVIPAYLWYLPYLAFVDQELEHYQQMFGCEIHCYPHPSYYRWIANGVYQPPARLRAIAELDIVPPDYDQTWALIKADLGLPADTWVADGVRAADSIVRRASFVRNGVMKQTTRKVSPIADMLKGELMELLGRHQVDLPIDYDIWGRSFDGIDYRFMAPMAERLPGDFARVHEWFPLVDVELERGKVAHAAAVDADDDASDYAQRNRQEIARRKVATDGNAVMCVCFASAKDRAKWSRVVGTDASIVPHDIVERAFTPVADGRRAQRPIEPRFGRLNRSPLAELETTDSLAADSLREAACIKDAMLAADARPCGHAFTDTAEYVAVWFNDCDQLDTFLKTRRLMRFGRFYLDGSRWMATVR